MKEPAGLTKDAFKPAEEILHTVFLTIRAEIASFPAGSMKPAGFTAGFTKPAGLTKDAFKPAGEILHTVF